MKTSLKTLTAAVALVLVAGAVQADVLPPLYDAHGHLVLLHDPSKRTIPCISTPIIGPDAQQTIDALLARCAAEEKAQWNALRAKLAEDARIEREAQRQNAEASREEAAREAARRVEEDRLADAQREADQKKDALAALQAALQKEQAQAQATLRANAARARQAEVIKSYREQVAKAEADQAQRGYQVMTIDDFLLDGKKLVAANAKVAVAGLYKKIGQMTVLLPNAMTALQNHADTGVAVLTDDATRSTREFVLNCERDPVGRGCQITFLGHATTCTRTTLVGSTDIPCLKVEDGWNIPLPQ
jgi:hypothetical protein